MGFRGGSDSTESTCNAGDLGSIPGSERSPGEGSGISLQYSCLENPHGQRNLAGYSPWGCKESDMTERLSTSKVKKISNIFEIFILFTYSRVSKKLGDVLRDTNFKDIQSSSPNSPKANYSA